MATLSPHPAAFPRLPADRRLGGLALTLLVHAVLILGWQAARTLTAPEEGEDAAVQWLRLPPPAPAPSIAPPPAPPAPRPVRTGRPAPAAQAAPEAAPAPASPLPEKAPAAEAPAGPAAESIVEDARRSAGSIARELRRQSRPLIVAPPDSPQIRLREGIEHAHAMARPRLWETPKIEELVNNTGDGARRTRVITGRSTYCLTERAPTTNVEMIEMHGKVRFTSCPKHETPAKQQVWRTARD
jgi:type IV secretory pathway VirB10-like protein